jgi:hypothetical protein
MVCLMAAGCEGPAPNPPSPLAPSAASAAAPTRINIVVSPAELPPGGGTAIVRIETVAGTSQAAPNARVALSASAGELEASEVTTDGTGHGQVTWRGTTSAIITARSGEVEATGRISIVVPNALPPPSQPRPPAPVPPPPPPPPVVLSATINSTPANPTTLDVVTLTVQLQNSDGSAVPAIATYAWTGVTQSTVASPAQAFPVSTNAVGVTVTTADGRTVTASGTVSVVHPALTTSLTAAPMSAAVGVARTLTLSVNGLSAGESVFSIVWDCDTAVAGTDRVADGTGTTQSCPYNTAGEPTAQAQVRTTLDRTAVATIRLLVTTP